MEDIITWVTVTFEQINEDDLIRSSTVPNSQQYLGHPQADYNVEGRVLSKGDTPETTFLSDNLTGDRKVLSYDGLGSDVTISYKRGTVNQSLINRREVNPLKRKNRFGFNSLKEIIKDIIYLLK